MAWVISLDDSPANAVARTVRTTGVIVRIVPHTPFGFGMTGSAGVVGSSATGGLHREDRRQRRSGAGAGSRSGPILILFLLLLLISSVFVFSVPSVVSLFPQHPRPGTLDRPPPPPSPPRDLPTPPR